LFEIKDRAGALFQHLPYRWFQARAEKLRVRDGGANLRSAVKKIHLRGEVAGHPDIVAIHEGQQFAPGNADAGVPGSGKPPILLFEVMDTVPIRLEHDFQSQGIG
jgi:hypothetical protein